MTDGTYVDLYSFTGSAGQPISISATSSAFDSYLYLFDSTGTVLFENDDSGTGSNSRIPIDEGVIVLPTTGTYYIGVNSFAISTGDYTVSLSTDAACSATAATLPQTYNSSLTTGDCKVNGGGLIYYTKLYTFTGTIGQRIALTMSSSAFDAYLILHTPSGAGTVEDDDGGGDPTARIPATSGYLTLSETGTYTVEATTFDPANTGAYVLTLLKETVRTPYDFDGDGKTDIGVYRGTGGSGGAEYWYLKSGTVGGSGAFGFGQSSDVAAPADFTGDGKTDLAFFRPSNGYWYILRSEDSTYYAFPFGANGDTPAPADYDGDGKADPAVFRASGGVWYILRSSDGGVSSVPFGISTDKPIPSDYDGDGNADVGVFRANGASGAEWWYLGSTVGGKGFGFGQSADKAVPGDFTGDGKTDLAFFRPSNGQWYILRSEDASFYAFPFGASGDVPTPGDFDGDKKMDAAVFRSGQWYVLRSSDGAVSAPPFGISTDKPLPSVLLP